MKENEENRERFPEIGNYVFPLVVRVPPEIGEVLLVVGVQVVEIFRQLLGRGEIFGIYERVLRGHAIELVVVV